MAFVRFAIQQVVWTTPPETFKSSNRVERGFCRSCGTPLTYRSTGGPFISLTLNSLDKPEEVQPEFRFATDQKPGWLNSLDNVPNEFIEMTTAPGFISNQIP